MSKKFALVGHCDIDGPRLQQVLSSGLPEYKAFRVNSDEDLERALEEGVALLVVNREPVGFDTSGIEMIRDVRAEHPEQKALLVSDYDDAQAEAQQAGALPGFGKKEIGSPALIDLVERALKVDP